MQGTRKMKKTQNQQWPADKARMLPITEPKDSTASVQSNHRDRDACDDISRVGAVMPRVAHEIRPSGQVMAVRPRAEEQPADKESAGPKFFVVTSGDQTGTTPSPRRAPTAKEYRARKLQEWKSGPSMPLAVLADKERELHEQSKALADISNYNQTRPDRNLVAYQIRNVAGGAAPRSHLGQTLKREAAKLYVSLKSQDPFEGMIDGAIVGLNILSMEAMSRVNRMHDPRAREIETRLAVRGLAMMSDLIKHREARRGQSSSSVAVGSVNVEPGGQAIVGNVKVSDRRDETTEPVSPRNKAKPTDCA
jgi:hypothetical protein